MKEKLVYSAIAVFMFGACTQQSTNIAESPESEKLIIEGVERGANASNDDTYTLYRNSPLDVTMRLHVGTFDSIEGYDDRLYNYENCQRAAKAFGQDPVFADASFFCEQGRFVE